jgi:hypothetical protein
MIKKGDNYQPNRQKKKRPRLSENCRAKDLVSNIYK